LNESEEEGQILTSAFLATVFPRKRFISLTPIYHIYIYQNTGTITGYTAANSLSLSVSQATRMVKASSPVWAHDQI